MSRLIDACENHDLKQVMKALDEWHYNVSDVSEGKQAIHVCAQNGKNDILEFLLRRGADPNAVGNAGKRPLHYACDGGNLQGCRILLKYKADVNARMNSFVTPLHYILEQEYGDNVLLIMRLFIDNKAYINAQDGDGETPLHKTVQWNSPCMSIIQVLCNIYHVDTTIRNNASYTAYDIAKILKKKNVMFLIKDYEKITGMGEDRSMLPEFVNRFIRKISSKIDIVEEANYHEVPSW